MTAEGSLFVYTGVSSGMESGVSCVMETTSVCSSFFYLLLNSVTLWRQSWVESISLSMSMIVSQKININLVWIFSSLTVIQLYVFFIFVTWVHYCTRLTSLGLDWMVMYSLHCNLVFLYMFNLYSNVNTQHFLTGMSPIFYFLCSPSLAPFETRTKNYR